MVVTLSNTPDITEGIPFYLSRRLHGALVSSVRKNFFDIYVNEIPFRLAATDDNPYRREPMPIRTQQMDTAPVVGERSLDNGWWRRSQSSFHLGAGARYPDILEGEDAPYRFFDSSGVEVFEPGEVRLCRKMDLLAECTGDVYLAGGQYESSESGVGAVDAVWVVDADTSITREDGENSDPISINDDPQGVIYVGDKVVVITDQGLVWFDPDAESSNGDAITSASGKVNAWWAKGRLWIARDNELHVVPLASEDLDDSSGAGPYFTHPLAGWRWTGLATTGGAVFISGYSGSHSEIHAITVDESGDLPELTSPAIVAELPEGEIVTGLYGYLGTYVAIGTNRGVRIAIANGPSLTYGPLLFETSEPVYAFVGHDRFLYAGARVGSQTTAGAVKIDLGNPIADLIYPYANSLDTGVEGAVTSLALFGTSGRLVIGVSGAGAYLESATEYTSSGFVQTGWHRFGMMEPKHWKRVRVSVDVPAGGQETLAIGEVQEDGDVVNVTTIGASTQLRELPLPALAPAVAMGYKFTLASIDGGDTPVLRGYQIKALPAARRNRLLQLPLGCFDFERDKNGAPFGYEGFAQDRLEALESLEERADTVLLRERNRSYEVVIEQVQFMSTTPPKKTSDGFGGVVLLTVRTTL